MQNLQFTDSGKAPVSIKRSKVNGWVVRRLEHDSGSSIHPNIPSSVGNSGLILQLVVRSLEIVIPT